MFWVLNWLIRLTFLCIKIALAKIRKKRLCNQRLLRSFTSFRRNGAIVVLRPQFASAYANANSDFTPANACLGLLAVRNSYTPFCFSYEKQHSVKLLTGTWLDLTLFGRRTCQNPQKKAIHWERLPDLGRRYEKPFGFPYYSYRYFCSYLEKFLNNLICLDY